MKRSALALLILMLLLIVATGWLLRGSLPVLDGEVVLKGLAAPVTVRRDALGVVTIEAQSQADAMRALGFVHAQVRYFQMDLMRRSAAGELSELLGRVAIEIDRQRRIHRLRARAKRRLNELPARQRVILKAYVGGVNAGLWTLDVRPWPYLVLGAEPEPWHLAGSILVVDAMYLKLQDETNARELALWRIKAHVPRALFDLLTHPGSAWDAPLSGQALGQASLPEVKILNLRELPAPSPDTQSDLPAPQITGSNNFAVAGTLTPYGHAMLANDMHLKLRVPNIWFRARLRYPDPRAPGGYVDVTGFTLPGVPGMIVGSNGYVAWGFTNSFGDWLDWKGLPPCPGESPCREIQVYQERIKVAGAPDEVMTVKTTGWGPLMHRNPDGSALALRWVAHLPGSINLGLIAFAYASSVREVLELADRVALPAQNLLVADRTGHIAWRLLGPVPLRDDDCVATPVGNPASLEETVRCEPWPITTATDLQLTEFPSGRAWTANARVVSGAMLQKIGNGGYILGARAQQIRNGLMAKRQFDEADLLAIQLDNRAVFLKRWWRLLQRLADQLDGSALDRLAAAAEHWNGRAAPESVSYRLVRAWRLQIHEHIANGLTAPARAALGGDFKMPQLPQLESAVWPLITQRPHHLLPRRFRTWAALFEEAAKQVDEEMKAPLSKRNWGEVNIAHICHPLAGALPEWLQPLLCMPEQPLAGDVNMPRVLGPDYGASERMVVAPGREAQGITHMPGGQGGHPLSPFWGAGHQAWVQGKAAPFLPGPTQHSLILRPAE